MRIAVASGKGGTGKTTIATSLALSLVDYGEVWYIDCDVEAPNGHLFLKPDLKRQSQAIILTPEIQADRCSLCGKCIEVCQFHALVKVDNSILVFQQLCHGCGSCTSNCPEEAIKETPNPIGVLESGLTRDGIHFFRGILSISEPMPAPIISQLKKYSNSPSDAITILDSPPGASCSVVETLRGSDFVLLVTEPTPFGLHDLKQMLGIIIEMDIPAGVIINRESKTYLPMINFCAANNLSVLMHIPYDRRIAEGVAKGMMLTEIYPEFTFLFQKMFNQINTLPLTKRKSHASIN